MNIKLKPPCWVRVDGKGEILALRNVYQPSRMLVLQGWRGLVARVQNKKGTGLVEYHRLLKADPLPSLTTPAKAAKMEP